MIDICTYQDADREEIIQLVLHCQNDGTRPIVGVENQPDLLCIHEKYFLPGGYFWVAKDKNKVVGSVGLMNCGAGIGVLKKFFVYEDYRGEPHHLGQKLCACLFAFAEKNHFNQIVLDTPKNTERGHKFYKKAGFKQIEKEALPVQYDYTYEDSDFFLLRLT